MGIPFGRYELLRKIASGGMGQVLLARKGAEGFEKLVVIKRILPHLVEDEEFFTMFLDEARITMRLDHPNIARINEFGSENGVHFIEMEYVAGEDIRRVERMARAKGGALPLGVILRVIADSAAGLDFAHKAKSQKGEPLNLVHRDVSPQNILVGFDGSVKLIDFGVAKAAGRAQHTATGILKGKFPYMSPEQAEGLDLDARSDVFALGIVLWELLTGKRLFKGENDLMTQRLVRACQVAPPSSIEPTVPKGLDDIVLKALAKEPADRWPDAHAFRLALEDFALKNAIPSSAAHLSALMQELYAERIERDADPRHLEEDSGLTDLDVGGLTKPGGGVATVANGQRDRATGSVPNQTIAVPPPGKGGGKTVWLVVGAVVIAGIVAAGVFLRPRPVEPVVTPPPNVGGGPGTVTPPPVVEVLTLSIVTEPSAANIELGGDLRGQSPLELKLEKTKLPLLLRATRDGYDVAQVTVTETTASPVTLTLKKKVRTGNRPPPDIKTTR